jgi:phospholipid-binding lipoprotein MlaA
MIHLFFYTKTLRALKLALLVISACMAMGCAASPAAHDPLESMNRKVFSVNEALDRNVLKPTALAYKKIIPSLAQKGVSNFFSNLQSPWSSVNMMLQGRIGDGAATAVRFGANSTVGLLGFMDIARHLRLPAKRAEDFGLTLDTWGIGSGPFIVLPIFGASNLRDVMALPVDSLGNPAGSVSATSTRNTLMIAETISQRADFMALSELMDSVALDKYLLMRDAHLSRRNRSASKADDASATEEARPAHREE